MTELMQVLAGREERAARQKFWLSQRDAEGAPEYFLCQIGLNIPGYPKRLPNDMEAINACRALLISHFGAKPAEAEFLDNGAGLCWLGVFECAKYEAKRLKEIAIEAENLLPAGRLLDIDIITAEGPLSRIAMGLPERRCLLCAEPAKVCARLGTHSLAELRRKAARMLSESAIRR